MFTNVSEYYRQNEFSCIMCMAGHGCIEWLQDNSKHIATETFFPLFLLFYWQHTCGDGEGFVASKNQYTRKKGADKLW